MFSFDFSNGPNFACHFDCLDLLNCKNTKTISKTIKLSPFLLIIRQKKIKLSWKHLRYLTFIETKHTCQPNAYTIHYFVYSVIVLTFSNFAFFCVFVFFFFLLFAQLHDKLFRFLLYLLRTIWSLVSKFRVRHCINTKFNLFK